MLFVFFAALLAVAVWAIAQQRRKKRVMGTQVLIGEAMLRRNISPADAAAAGLEPEVFAAVRKCTNCGSDTECRILLANAGTPDLPRECPNRGFFYRVAAHKESLEADPPPGAFGR